METINNVKKNILLKIIFKFTYFFDKEFVHLKKTVVKKKQKITTINLNKTIKNVNDLSRKTPFCKKKKANNLSRVGVEWVDPKKKQSE